MGEPEVIQTNKNHETNKYSGSEKVMNSDENMCLFLHETETSLW